MHKIHKKITAECFDLLTKSYQQREGFNNTYRQSYNKMYNLDVL